MKKLQLLSRLLVAALIFTVVTHSGNLSAKDRRWVQSTAYLIPPETAPDGEGYFAIADQKDNPNITESGLGDIPERDTNGFAR